MTIFELFETEVMGWFLDFGVFGTGIGWDVVGSCARFRKNKLKIVSRVEKTDRTNERKGKRKKKAMNEVPDARTHLI